jgi:hypothetical protein
MDQFDVLIYIVGIVFLFGLIYLLGNYNNRVSKKKIDHLITEFGLSFYKIPNKNCSVKRLNKAMRIEIKDHSYLFNKCDIYIENGFILIQGFKDSFFRSASKAFIITAGVETFKKKFSGWTVLKPKLTELSQTEVKIVYTAKTNNSDYSLIVSGLNAEDHKSINDIKNYCA